MSLELNSLVVPGSNEPEADGMANNVAPEQTYGSNLICVCSVCSDLSVLIIGFIVITGLKDLC